jgi:ABC-type protease/lipase transport system fused ATPase/permease subunit
MVLNEGRVQAFGPREQVIAALRPAAKVPVEATAQAETAAPAEVVKPAARARRAQHAKPVA